MRLQINLCNGTVDGKNPAGHDTDLIYQRHRNSGSIVHIYVCKVMQDVYHQQHFLWTGHSGWVAYSFGTLLGFRVGLSGRIFPFWSHKRRTQNLDSKRAEILLESLELQEEVSKSHLGGGSFTSGGCLGRCCSTSGRRRPCPIELNHLARPYSSRKCCLLELPLSASSWQRSSWLSSMVCSFRNHKDPTSHVEADKYPETEEALGYEFPCALQSNCP